MFSRTVRSSPATVWTASCGCDPSRRTVWTEDQPTSSVKRFKCKAPKPRSGPVKPPSSSKRRRVECPSMPSAMTNNARPCSFTSLSVASCEAVPTSGQVQLVRAACPASDPASGDRAPGQHPSCHWFVNGFASCRLCPFKVKCKDSREARSKLQGHFRRTTEVIQPPAVHV